MDFSFTEEQERFRQEVSEWLDREMTPELRAENEHREMGPGPHAKAFQRHMGQAGYLGIGWPKEFGGQGAPPMNQYIFYEELSKRGVQIPSLTLSSVGPTIAMAGTEDQKQEYLPKILAGEIEFALGYTEPGAGTDLASLQTRAVIDGDDFVINGQKVFTLAAHHATHVWLAARTDPEARKHQGISIIIIPIDTPGITIRPLWHLGDGRTNEVFYEDVRVPRKNLMGELNRGWYLAATALDFERVGFGHYGSMSTRMQRLIKYAKETHRNGKPLSQDPLVRAKLAQLAMDTELVRLLDYRAAWMIEAGKVPNAEASAVKVFHSELSQRLADQAQHIMGLYGQLRPGSKHAPLDGKMEREYRGSYLMRFGAGTNEIQRNIIAQRRLGMPRGA